MGLDTSHDAWHGPYSSFNEFRRNLAKEIGIDLNEMEGFDGEVSWDTVDHKIKPLLNHSDCDGELTVDECKQVAEGLEEILAGLQDDGTPFSLYQQAKQFMEGCKRAFIHNEVLDFH